MTNQNKKENTTNDINTVQNQAQSNWQQNQLQGTNNIEENQQSFNRALDETKQNIQRNVDEARTQIPRYTQIVNEVQEQTIQATKEIADDYIDYQKQAISSLQSAFGPFVQYNNNQLQLWNNQDYFRRLPEVYARIATSYAENSIAVSRMVNDLTFANINAFKSIVNNVKDNSKQLSDLGKRNAKVYEEIAQNNQSIASSISQNNQDTASSISQNTSQFSK